MGNNTEGTAIVTAFGYFYIRCIPRRRALTARMGIIQMAYVVHEAGPLAFFDRVDCFENPVPGARAEKGIDFRHFLEQIFLILLAQTARDDEDLAAAFRLIAGSL